MGSAPIAAAVAPARPESPPILRHAAKAQAKYASQFPKLNLFTIDQAFGGWASATKQHFADGGEFDRIYARR